MTAPNKKLKGGHTIPLLGFGTWHLTGEEGTEAVLTALDVGYRHIDTAPRYENQSDIGRALSRSSIPRKELFIASKKWRDDLSYEAVIDECDDTLAELACEYLDLYLIHWPNSEYDIRETLDAMAQLKKEGKSKAIGVSNFTKRHLTEALDGGVPIVMNQIELHPSFQQPQLVDFCTQNGIAVTAYSPIGQGKDLELAEVAAIAHKHNRTPSQVILAWLRAKDIVAIPRARKREHIEENFASLSLTLSREEVAMIDAIALHERLIAPPWNEFDD